MWPRQEVPGPPSPDATGIKRPPDCQRQTRGPLNPEES